VSTSRVRPFDALSVHGRLRRLRRLAEGALRRYEIPSPSLTLLAHEENTSFRVDAADGERYVLRISRTHGSPFHPPRSEPQVRSEVEWLLALRDAGLPVPEPVSATDGSTVIAMHVDGDPTPRTCVLFRWVPGRFVDARLTPSHLERVGQMMARFHHHSATFAPRQAFERPEVGAIDAEIQAHIVETVGRFMPASEVATIERAIETVTRARSELGRPRDAFGLIHGDLHQDNYLFRCGRVAAIDFDDCGWGHFLYDLAVTLSEIRERSGYEGMRSGLLRGYRVIRPLALDLEPYLDVFQVLRTLQLTLWFIEQRDHPAFADWHRGARRGIAEIDELLRPSSSCR
jgi:Ser/Thr protein kinase RdoA (MazF antagonist)